MIEVSLSVYVHGSCLWLFSGLSVHCEFAKLLWFASLHVCMLHMVLCYLLFRPYLSHWWFTLLHGAKHSPQTSCVGGPSG